VIHILTAVSLSHQVLVLLIVTIRGSLLGFSVSCATDDVNNLLGGIHSFMYIQENIFRLFFHFFAIQIYPKIAGGVFFRVLDPKFLKSQNHKKSVKK
jgi:hypothetical protein